MLCVREGVGDEGEGVKNVVEGMREKGLGFRENREKVWGRMGEGGEVKGRMGEGGEVKGRMAESWEMSVLWVGMRKGGEARREGEIYGRRR